MAALDQAEQSRVSFEEILGGALGESEAQAARRWLDGGALVEPPPDPAGLIFAEEAPACYDTRVLEAGKRRHPRTQDDPVAPKPAKRLTLGDGVMAPQVKRTKSAPAPSGSAYGRDSFIGHGDAIGTLARRRGRTSDAAQLNPVAAPPSMAANKQAATAAAERAPTAGPEATAPVENEVGSRDDRWLPLGWTVLIKEKQSGKSQGQRYKNYRHDASGKTFVSYLRAKAYWESPAAAAAGTGSSAALPEAEPPLPPATPDDLPAGWSVYDVDEEEPPGSGNMVKRERFVSPEGLVCTSWDTALAAVVATSSSPSPQADFSEAVEWVRSMATSPRMDFPAALEAEPVQHLLTMQRLRAATYSEEHKQMRFRLGKFRSGKRKSEAGQAEQRARPVDKKQKAQPAEQPADKQRTQKAKDTKPAEKRGGKPVPTRKVEQKQQKEKK